MVENPFDPTPATTPDSTPEPDVAQSAPAVKKKPSAATEEPETKTEAVDKQELEQPENKFDDLDEELSDLGESTDTVWLLRRVGIGIIKALLILGGLGIVGWLIWGETNTSSPENPIIKTAIEKSVEKSVGSVKKEITTVTKKKEKKPLTKKIDKSPSTSLPEAKMSFSGQSLSFWNYWLESQRIALQKGISADVLRWKREVEVLFEVPFPQQINGKNAITRNYQVGVLLQRIEDLLSQSTLLQTQLERDIADFSEKAAQAKQQSLQAEQEFLAALKNSNPVGISAILERKIEAEKQLQQNAVDAEARQIFAQKISEYDVVLNNIQTILTINREAIVQNIQVVNFPSDPFDRVISPSAWGIQ